MKVQKMFGWSLSVLILLFTMRTAIAEDAKPFSASVSVDYFSKYVWRGQSINDESVLQTNVSGSAYGFTGSIWSNSDLTNDRKGEFSEVDYSLDYSHTFVKKDRIFAWSYPLRFSEHRVCADDGDLRRFEFQCAAVPVRQVVSGYQ